MPLINAYITHSSALPPGRQMEWLKQMTVDLCEKTEHGELSALELSQANEILRAWSHLPTSASIGSTRGKSSSNSKLGTNNNNECNGSAGNTNGRTSTAGTTTTATTASIENAMAVESLVKRMIDERIAGNANAQRLTVHDYNCLLQVWALTGAGEAAAERCEQILNAMQEQAETAAAAGARTTVQGRRRQQRQQLQLEPDLTSYKTVLFAWRQVQYEHVAPQVTSGRKKHERGKNNSEDDATASSGLTSPYRALRVLEEMIHRAVVEKQDPALLPDAECFQMVLQTWSRSGLPEAAEQTERILGMQERLYEAMNCESRFKPQTVGFNAVLSAWSRSQNVEFAGTRASDILAFMELLTKQGDATVAPDATSYFAVLSALAKSKDQAKAARRADGFVRHAVASYRASKRQDEDAENFGATTDSTDMPCVSPPVIPDTILFNLAMGCWLKSNLPGAYRNTRSLLDLQIELSEDYSLNCKPDVYGYTSAIACCAAEASSDGSTLSDRLHAFKVATEIFELQEQQQHDPAAAANHVSYAAMLKCVAKLLPQRLKQKTRLRNERHYWVSRIWQACCEAGCVNELVLYRLREACGAAITTGPSVPSSLSSRADSHVLYRKLMQGHQKQNLPSEWTRNINVSNDYHKSKKKHNTNNHNRRKK